MGMILAGALLFGATAYAAPTWVDAPPGETATQAPDEGDKRMKNESPVYGYMGNANTEIDIDGDGEMDLNVPMEDIIDVTVPLDVSVVAMYNGAEKEFYSAIGTVRNNSAYSSVEVSMTSFVRQAGSTSEVTLAKWDATRLTQHQVAMQIQPTGTSITKFPAQDVTTIRTSPVDMGMIGPESATEYIFDGQFENSLVRTHKGEEVVFDTVFLVSKAGA